jgi:type IV fimbrial biogenesis protein FimT
MMRGQRSHARGFTLVELMVTVAVAGVLAALGAPAMQGMIERYRLRASANELFAAIELTRAQAIGRGKRVMLMPADSARVDWSSGWVVFVDRNGSLGPDAGDEIIFQQGPLRPGIRVASTFSSHLAPFYVAYNDAGRSCSASNSMAARPGSLSLALGRNTRHIKINMLGRVRICDPQVQRVDCSGPGGD